MEMTESQIKPATVQMCTSVVRVEMCYDHALKLATELLRVSIYFTTAPMKPGTPCSRCVADQAPF